MRNLDKEDLKIGDIFIYEIIDFSYYEFIKKLYEGINEAIEYSLPHMIAWFDPGKDKRAYFHAAIWDGEYIIEAGAGGIHRAKLEADANHPVIKNIYVYRYNSPLSADKFKDAFAKFPTSDKNEDIGKIGYSYQTAFLLAIIVSMQKGSIGSVLSYYLGSATAKIFEGAFLHWINGVISERPQEMVVCSTLVSMIYEEAGYPIKVDLFEISNSKVKTPLSPEIKRKLDDLAKKTQAEILIQQKEVGLNTNSIDDIVLVTPRQLAESKDTEFLGVVKKG